MRLKTKLVLAITGLVFLVVCTLSWVFLGQLLRQRISQAYADNDMVAREILLATRRAIETRIRGNGTGSPSLAGGRSFCLTQRCRPDRVDGLGHPVLPYRVRCIDR